VEAFVDLEVVVAGSDLERVVGVEDEGGTYELSAVEAIHQLISQYGEKEDVQETTTGAGAASELDSALEEASALELASEGAAEEEEEEDRQESSPPPTFIF